MVLIRILVGLIVDIYGVNIRMIVVFNSDFYHESYWVGIDVPTFFWGILFHITKTAISVGDYYIPFLVGVGEEISPIVVG